MGLVVLAVVVGVISAAVVTRERAQAAGEIYLEPAASTGPNPFTKGAIRAAVPVPPSPTTTVPDSSVAPDAPAEAAERAPEELPTTTTVTTITTVTTTTTAPLSPTTSAAFPPADRLVINKVAGANPGLYGGSGDQGVCDPDALVAFLGEDPAKAAAWVGALNADPTMKWSGGRPLTAAEIPQYVSELRSVVLRYDTRVTNHGFLDGRATPRQSVLQAGTAVLVDSLGVPRVRCACGNPLTAPRRLASWEWRGVAWGSVCDGGCQETVAAPRGCDTLAVVDPATNAHVEVPCAPVCVTTPCPTTTSSSDTTMPPETSVSTQETTVPLRTPTTRRRATTSESPTPEVPPPTTPETTPPTTPRTTQRTVPYQEPEPEAPPPTYQQSPTTRGTVRPIQQTTTTTQQPSGDRVTPTTHRTIPPG